MLGPMNARFVRGIPYASWLLAVGVSAGGCMLDLERGRFESDAATRQDEADAGSRETAARGDAGRDAENEAEPDAARVADDAPNSPSQPLSDSGTSMQPDGRTPPQPPPMDAGPGDGGSSESGPGDGGAGDGGVALDLQCMTPFYVEYGATNNLEWYLGKVSDGYLYRIDVSDKLGKYELELCRDKTWPAREYALRIKGVPDSYWSTRPRSGVSNPLCTCASAPIDKYERFRLVRWDDKFSTIQSVQSDLWIGWPDNDDADPSIYDRHPGTLHAAPLQRSLMMLKHGPSIVALSRVHAYFVE